MWWIDILFIVLLTTNCFNHNDPIRKVGYKTGFNIRSRKCSNAYDKQDDLMDQEISNSIKIYPDLFVLGFKQGYDESSAECSKLYTRVYNSDKPSVIRKTSGELVQASELREQELIPNLELSDVYSEIAQSDLVGKNEEEDYS